MASELEPGVADFSVQNAYLHYLLLALDVLLMEEELVSEHTRRTR